MLADPQSITFDGSAESLPRIRVGELNAMYSSADGEFTLRVSHQETSKRVRRMVRIDRKVIAADPLTAVNSHQSAGVYIVIDEPLIGFTDAWLDNQVDALIAWLTPANIAKVLASES